MDSSGLKDAQVQSYSPDSANVPSCEDTLLPPGEYDWTIRLRRRSALWQITLTTCYLWTRPLTVAQIAERFEPNTVLWAFRTIQPSSFFCVVACLIAHHELFEDGTLFNLCFIIGHDPAIERNWSIKSSSSLWSTVMESQMTTRHRASTSMYSLTFCVRVMLPERHQWKPAVQAAAVMLRTPAVTCQSQASSVRTPRRAFALCRHIAWWTQACN